MNVNRRTFDWFNWNKRKKEIIVYLIETRRINHQRNWTDVTLSIWYSVYKTLHRQYTKLMKLKSEKSQYISLIIKVFDFFLNELWYCIAWTFIHTTYLMMMVIMIMKSIKVVTITLDNYYFIFTFSSSFYYHFVIFIQCPPL